MKKSLFSILTLLMVLSCQEQQLIPENVLGQDELYASIEQVNATRTSMDENNNVLWSEGDQLVAFMKTSLPSKFLIQEQSVGTTTGTFTKVDEEGNDDIISSGQEQDHNVVMYPYSSDIWCMKNDDATPASSYKLNVVLPENQKYAENSFADGAFPMVAVSSDYSFTFKNICGGIKLQFKGVDKIRTIRLEGLNAEKISGKSSVICFVNADDPIIGMDDSDASGIVTLDCGEGVQLSQDNPTTFILAVPPVTFEGGMKITVTDTDGFSRELSNASSNTIKRSSLLTFPVITYSQTGVFELPEGSFESYELPAEGGTIEIPVKTNIDYEVTIPTEAHSWITMEGPTKALREETIILNVAANSFPETRTAEIHITSSGETLKTITVSQEAAPDFNLSLSDAIDLSAEGTANSYIVNEAGCYRFVSTKGNSTESVGAVYSVETLWETFGTDVTPSVGDLIKSVEYQNGWVVFETPGAFREGNAVIAAKDAAGTILWSWHIWLTDQPEEQLYYNNAGIMMDRNLGATSATPGDVGALGLLYQWGRKDPFLGSSSISNDRLAVSTLTWPSSKESNSNYGTVEYVTRNPTTFITAPHEWISNGSSYQHISQTEWDWHFSSRDDALWASDKTKYDPCPAGWRVPDGGRSSVWAIAFNLTDLPQHSVDQSNYGIDFSNELGSASSIWYPIIGYLDGTYNGYITSVGSTGTYLTVTPSGFDGTVRPFDITYSGLVVPSFDGVRRTNGYAVRCVKENYTL